MAEGLANKISMVQLSRPRRVLWLAMGFCALLVLKVGFLVAFAPTVMPDSGGYIGLADLMRAGRWTGPALTEGPSLAMVYRMLGYPVVIAAAKIAVGQYGLWLVVFVQFAASFIATAFVFRLARAFGLHFWFAFACAGASAISLPLLLDQAILTDSLNASLLTIAVCVLAEGVLRTGLSLWVACVVGMLIAAAFLLREAMIYLVVSFLPLLAAAAFAGLLRGRRTGLSNQISGGVKLALMLLPLFLVHYAYKEWNRERVGAPIVTTAARTALVLALSEAYRVDPRVFSGDTPLDRVARATLHTFEFEEIMEINRRLQHDYGRTDLQMANDAFTAYWHAWRTYPLAMLHRPLSYMHESQAYLTLRPIASIRDLLIWNTASGFDFATERAVMQGRWWMAPFATIHRLCILLSTIVFAGFLLITPWRVVSEQHWKPVVIAGAAIWILYLGFFFTYAIVSLEARYLAPVVPASLVLGVANLNWIYHKRRAAKRS
jgi:hypothetical protein